MDLPHKKQKSEKSLTIKEKYDSNEVVNSEADIVEKDVKI